MQANTTATGRASDPPLPLVPAGGSPRHDAIPPLVRAVLEAWALIVTEDDRIEAWVPVLLDALAARYGSKPATAQKVTAEAARLLKFLIARGAVRWRDVIAALVSEWCWAARPDRSGRHRSAAPSTARNRRWAAQAVLETAAMLGAPVDAAAAGEHTAGRGDEVPARPLTADEEQDVRAVAASTALVLRAPLVVFAFAGGTAAEIAALTATDVDIDECVVRFGGDAARVNPLDEWSRTLIGLYLRNARPPPAAPLCVNGRLDPLRATHSVTVRLNRAIAEVGLSGRRGVVARSLRLTAARHVLQEHSLEAAARFLGSRSLNRTAEALGYDWRNGHV